MILVLEKDWDKELRDDNGQVCIAAVRMSGVIIKGKIWEDIR